MRWVHARLHNEEWEESTEESFGDKLQMKAEEIDCLSEYRGDTPSQYTYKNQELRLFVQTIEVNILGLAKMNVNWSLVNNQNRLHKRMMTWWERRHIAVAHNQHN